VSPSTSGRSTNDGVSMRKTVLIVTRAVSVGWLG
jgi:hypothetical protein